MILLKIAICDDDKLVHARLGGLFMEYQGLKETELICTSFYSGLDLVEAVHSNEYDLILLDVIMPGFSGIQVAKEIRLFNGVVKIVFLSSSPEFAVDSYSVGAYSYLLKPASSKDLFVILDKIHAEADSQVTEGLLVKSREGIIRIPFCAIEYAEVMNKTVSFHLTDGSSRDASGSLLDFEPQLLSQGDFLKVHRSFLINLRHVQTLNAKGVITHAGHTLPVSKMLYAQIKEAYLKYLFASQPKAPKPTAVPTVSMAASPLPPAAKPPDSTYRILLVDDDVEQQAYWANPLQVKGCTVDLAISMEAATQLAGEAAYDCIVLDVMLGEEASFSHCAQLRELTGAPVVFLSSLTDSDSQLQGFLSGGTDYITKDTPPDLFWVKIEARLRLSRTGKMQLSFDPLVLELSTRRVLIDQEELILTPTEFDLLWLLAEHPGRVYTPDELYRAVWGSGQGDSGQSIQVHLSRMRRKLEKACPSHYFIETAWGQGYRFVPGPGPTEPERLPYGTI